MAKSEFMLYQTMTGEELVAEEEEVKEQKE